MCTSLVSSFVKSPKRQFLDFFLFLLKKNIIPTCLLLILQTFFVYIVESQLNLNKLKDEKNIFKFIVIAIISRYVKVVLPLVFLLSNNRLERQLYSNLVVSFIGKTALQSEINFDVLVNNIIKMFSNFFYVIIPHTLVLVFMIIETLDTTVLLNILCTLLIIGVFLLFFVPQSNNMIKYFDDLLKEISFNGILLARNKTSKQINQVLDKHLRQQQSAVVDVYIQEAVFVTYIIAPIVASLFVIQYYKKDDKIIYYTTSIYIIIMIIASKCQDTVVSINNITQVCTDIQRKILINYDSKNIYVQEFKSLHIKLANYYNTEDIYNIFKNTVVPFDLRKLIEDCNIDKIISYVRSKFLKNKAIDIIDRLNNLQPLMRDIDFTIRPKSMEIVIGSKKYDLQFNKSPIIVCLGESGSGKSTLIKLLLGLKYSSNVFFNDLKICDIDPLALGKIIKYFSQQSVLIENLSISENFGLFCSNLLRVAQNKSLSDSDDILRGMYPIIQKNMMTNEPIKNMKISGGEKHRLSLIFQSGSSKPKILIGDEVHSKISEDAQLIENEKYKKMQDNDGPVIFYAVHTEKIIDIANVKLMFKDGKLEYYVRISTKWVKLEDMKSGDTFDNGMIHIV